MVGSNSFVKTICSICYEDLKPIVEDLQAISICGHVFHELCLQQWFEYCTNAKRKSCPVCKQTCTGATVCRLYFQSVGDPNDPSLSQKQVVDCVENPEELRREVKKLEGKVLGLSSVLERQQNDFKELNEELCFCKEQVKKETSLKNEALIHKESTKRLLHLRSEELDKSTLECMRLQERNMALAKELAALKLVSDLNLEEEEVSKLASLGNEANNRDTIDILKKSLVIRNKSYKELMAKCNVLGRGEARSLNKLEKAKEKLKTLKTRVQELEMAVEIKDNEVLRALKASKKTARKGAIEDDVHLNSNSSSITKYSSHYQFEEPTVSKANLDEVGSVANGLSCSKKTKKLKPSNGMDFSKAKDGRNKVSFDQEVDFHSSMEEDASDISKSMREPSHCGLKPQIGENLAVQKIDLSSPDTKKEALVQDGAAGLRSGSKNNVLSIPSAIDEDTMLILDDNAQVQPFIHIRDNTSHPVPISQPADSCFAGGLLGPDGAKRHLGKWCKRTQDKGSMQPSSTNPDDLIAVGADGRGGKIKVLRSTNQSSLASVQGSKETSTWAKKCKYGSKTSNLQSQGCLQLEHFFGRAGQ